MFVTPIYLASLRIQLVIGDTFDISFVSLSFFSSLPTIYLLIVKHIVLKVR